MHEGYSSQTCLSVLLRLFQDHGALMWMVQFLSQQCLDLSVDIGQIS